MTDPTGSEDGVAIAPEITRLAAYGVVRGDGRVLLCRIAPGYHGEGLWMLPGGGLEFGEAPEAGAVREVEEETGLLAAITGPVAVLSDTGSWPPAGAAARLHQVRFVYPMVIVGGEERVEVGGSTDEFGWFAASEIETLRLADIVERALGLEDHGR